MGADGFLRDIPDMAMELITAGSGYHLGLPDGDEVLLGVLESVPADDKDAVIMYLTGCLNAVIGAWAESEGVPGADVIAWIALKYQEGMST